MCTVRVPPGQVEQLAAGLCERHFLTEAAAGTCSLASLSVLYVAHVRRGSLLSPCLDMDPTLSFIVSCIVPACLRTGMPSLVCLQF